jgi:hypothetical protein
MKISAGMEHTNGPITFSVREFFAAYFPTLSVITHIQLPRRISKQVTNGYKT